MCLRGSRNEAEWAEDGFMFVEELELESPVKMRFSMEEEEVSSDKQDVIQPETAESAFNVRNLLPNMPDPEDSGDLANARRVLAMEAATAWQAFTRALVLAYGRFENHKSKAHAGNASAMFLAAVGDGAEVAKPGKK